jgi:hypothetical protein
MIRCRRPSELAKRRARRELSRIVREHCLGRYLPGDLERILARRRIDSHAYDDVGEDELTPAQWYEIDLVNAAIMIEWARAGICAGAAPAADRCEGRSRGAGRPAARRTSHVKRGGDSGDDSAGSSEPPPAGGLNTQRAVRP